MKKIFIVITMISISLCLFAEDIDPGLTELFNKIEKAWTCSLEEGLQIWKEITQEDCFIMIIDNGQKPVEQNTLNRDMFLKLYENIQKNNPAIKHIHNTIKIKTYGKIAYEIASLETYRKNGNVGKNMVFNIYRNDQDGWKIIFTGSPDTIKEVIK